MSRILVVTADVLRTRMAGPAMRAWHIARHLGREHEVRLVTTSPWCEVEGEGFSAQSVDGPGLAEAERWADVLVLPGYVAHHHPFLRESAKILVFDVYDPLHLETLALTRGTVSQARDDHVALSVATLNFQLQRADFLVCASERQRDLFIGQLCALGRANPRTYDDDPTLSSLIDVVPFGLPDVPPQHRHPALRGVVPGIAEGDDVLVWAGGVYDWFDPLTLVRAVALVAAERPSVRLYFMGLRHPNPDVPEMRMATATRELAAEMGLTGRHVFFNDDWVEYSERENYLLEADLGVTAHFASAETRFSFRTRALDYLWAALPTVTTEGDAFAELVTSEGLGLAVPPESPEALAGAITRLLGDPDLARSCRERSAAVRDRYRWSVVLEPLAEFCRHPRHAPDLAVGPSVESGDASSGGGETGAAEAAGAAADAAGAAADAAGAAADAADVPPAGEPVPVSGPLPEPQPAGPSVTTAATGARPGLVGLAVHHYRQGGMAGLARQATHKVLRVALERLERADQAGGRPA